MNEHAAEQDVLRMIRGRHAGKPDSGEVDVVAPPQAAENDAVPERFLRSYEGYFLPDLTVRDGETGGDVSLYICRDCHALTPDPVLHEAWHTRVIPSAETQPGGEQS